MTQFSVIVPTYERDEKLERALESIASQTCQDFELIVVDDNTRKEKRQEVKKIVENTEDIEAKYLVNNERQGVSSARNLGIDNASGRYIAFLDDDDEWKTGKLERELEKFEEGSYDVVYSAIEMYNEEVQDVVRREERLSLERELERDRIGSPSRVSVKKEILEAINGFDENIPSGEDWDIWIRLMKEGCNFGYIDEPLTRYHQDDDSKSNQKDVATEGREKITEKHSQLLEEAGRKVKARHHLNRAKKQHQLGDDSGTRKHLTKTLKNNPLELEAYALTAIYLIRRSTGLDLIPIAAEIKGKLK